MLGKVWVEGKSIAIRFDGSGKPSEDALSIVRSLSARKYDPPTKLWYAPLRISDEVDRLLRPQFEITTFALPSFRSFLLFCCLHGIRGSPRKFNT